MLNGLSLRGMYELLDFYNQTLAEGGFHSTPKAEEHIISIKRQIRSLTHEKDESERRIVKDYGIDGFIVRFYLPEWIETEEDAEEYFEAKEYLECRPSQYDCTGQLFTSWYRVFKINGRWVCYHSVGCDV